MHVEPRRSGRNPLDTRLRLSRAPQVTRPSLLPCPHPRPRGTAGLSAALAAAPETPSVASHDRSCRRWLIVALQLVVFPLPAGEWLRGVDRGRADRADRPRHGADLPLEPHHQLRPGRPRHAAGGPPLHAAHGVGLEPRGRHRRRRARRAGPRRLRRAGDHPPVLRLAAAAAHRRDPRPDAAARGRGHPAAEGVRRAAHPRRHAWNRPSTPASRSAASSSTATTCRRPSSSRSPSSPSACS